MTAGATDLDEDGRLDLLCSCSQVTQVALNLCGRSFAGPVELEFGLGNPVLGNPVFADVTLDGHLGLVTIDGETIRVFEGDGKGRLAPLQVIDRSSLGAVVKDVNGDLALDLIATGPYNEDLGTLVVYLNQRDGSLVEVGTVSLPGPSSDLELWDMDGEGVVNLVVTFGEHVYDGHLGITRGLGDGTFGPLS